MTSQLLVACPQHESKGYCFDNWIRAVDALTVAHEVLVVDNSPTATFAARWQARVPIVHIDVPGTVNDRIAQSMEYIRKHFVAGGYGAWLNLESDVIVPPQTAAFMLANAEHIDWLNLPYPYRGKIIYTGLGCALFSRRMMEAESFVDAPSDYSTDAWFWDRCQKKWSISWIRDSALQVEHRSNAR